MPWSYSQSTGRLKHNGVVVGTGYSGSGLSAIDGRNNPAMEDLRNRGPIPKGKYRIGNAYHHPRKGSNSMNLTPISHLARGRSGFMIHGNNIQNDASQGCIILGPQLRQQIAASHDNLLTVEP